MSDVSQLLQTPTHDQLVSLADAPPHMEIIDLRAGYGKMEVLHGISLVVGRGQSLCLIGPNGAGKSTILHAVFGIADVFGGGISVAGRDVKNASPQSRLVDTKIAYVLQTGSIFPDMTVEENLFLGGYILPTRRLITAAVERILDTNSQLAERRTQAAGALSGGERRVLELSRALMTNPELLLIDEPSIGLDPRGIDLVFTTLDRLQREEGKTTVIVEQNAKKGLEFAELGYVIVAGKVALAGRANCLVDDPQVGRLFLGRQ